MSKQVLKLLAFDTSTEHMSVAVQHGSQRLAYQGAGGAAASQQLVPTALRLLAEAGLRLPELDALVFGRGPGAFTGLRTACAVAQGLAWGAGLPVLPVDTLLALAEQARQEHGAERVLALLDARMNEVYSAAYIWQPEQHTWAQHAPLRVCAPQALQAPTEPGWVMAGNAFAAYGQHLPSTCPRLAALPTASALLQLAPGLLAAGQAVPAQQALPLYVRDKVALTTAERAASAA